MQPVVAKAPSMGGDVKPCLSPMRAGTPGPAPVPVSVSTADGASSAMELPSTLQPTLPDWEQGHNMFNRPEMLWRAFCASLNISGSAEMPGTSIEDFLSQKIEYAQLLLKYSCEEASAIWHERGSLRLCVESFFTVSPSAAMPDADSELPGAVVGAPVCVHVDFVAQKQMILGRDLVPVHVPGMLPLHARVYQAYRSSIPSVVAVIERKEKTTTPPFAAHGAFSLSRPLSVSFVITSKIPGYDMSLL